MIKFIATFANNFRKNCRKPLVRTTLGAVLATSIIGGILFSIFEPGADLFDGIYWTWVVMPTVGFGDFSPHTVPGRFLYIAVVGIGWFASVVGGGIVTASLIERIVKPHQETAEIDDDLQAIISTLSTAQAEIEVLMETVSHPTVVAALQQVHAERNSL